MNLQYLNIPLVEKKVTKKAKNNLYLVFNKRDTQEIIANIDKEFEKKLNEYLSTISKKFNQFNFDNPEKVLKYLLLNQMIKILDDMLKERILNLNEEVKKMYLIF